MIGGKIVIVNSTETLQRAVLQHKGDFFVCVAKENFTLAHWRIPEK